MQRPHFDRKRRNIAAAVTVGLVIGTTAFLSSRPADATPDPNLTDVGSTTASTAADSAPQDPSQQDDSPAAADSATAGAVAGEAGPADSDDSGSTAQGAPRFRSGEDPSFATSMGWPVDMPPALSGSLLPERRIVCYYGNPNSTRMGALGEYPKDEMLRRLKLQTDEWRAADPATPVEPCLHMVAVVAQGEPGTTGHYRSIMRDVDVQKVYEWSREIDGTFIVDMQVGTDDLRNILPRFDWILRNPDVHLAVDPEFYMKGGHKPGTKIGTMDAADINYAADHLANLVREHGLPPKVLVIHRFTRGMVTNSQDIRLRPEVQVVMHMDGWGAPWLKRDSYKDYVVREPVQYTGFKLFYHNDTKAGDPLMSAADVLRLEPKPVYIQYQ
ncbi:MAG: hypothetical protein WEF86_12935 [Gemmatimonadota bacterium]